MKKLFLTLLNFQIVLTCLALKPDRNYISVPDSFGLTCNEIKIKTADNVNLISWHIKPTSQIDKKTTIILAYGDAGNMSYWLNQVSMLSESGYTIVTFDYRGFGHSDNFTINNDYLYYNEFATDLESIIAWTKQNIKDNKIGIWALSMGTIMVNLALQKQQVDFVIAEGLVTNPIDIVKKIKKTKSKTLILPDNNYNLTQLSAKINCKYLLFAGTQDKFTTLVDSKYFAQIGNNRKVIEFNGNHLEGFAKLTKDNFGDNYIQQIDTFINE